MTEINKQTLSDKIHHEDNYNSFIPTDDVKEAIMELKEELFDKGNKDYINCVLKRIFGEELIE